MTELGGCEECHGAPAVAVIAVLAEGPYWRVCRGCLDRWLTSSAGGTLHVDTDPASTLAGSSTRAEARAAIARFRRSRFEVIKGGRL